MSTMDTVDLTTTGGAVRASDGERVTEAVRERYAASARRMLTPAEPAAHANAGCCGSTEQAVWGEGLYDIAACAALPDAAVLASLGCGNPTAVAALQPGELVLDLGSGGGIDVLLSARRVAPDGFAYGLDMTEEMLELARRNARDAGITNVEFRAGRIEAIPLPDEAIDVVISNCVVNLSADKAQVFREIARVLRPGGRLGVSDIVADDALIPADRATRGSFVGCVAGALSFAEYHAGLDAAGFEDITITPTHGVADGLHAAIVQARKPTDWTPDRVRSVDLPRPDAHLVTVDDEVEGGAAGCCGGAGACC